MLRFSDQTGCQGRHAGTAIGPWDTPAPLLALRASTATDESV